jgi:hypothetical protein
MFSQDFGNQWQEHLPTNQRLNEIAHRPFVSINIIIVQFEITGVQVHH